MRARPSPSASCWRERMPNRIAALANAGRTADRVQSLRASGAQSQRVLDDAIAQRDESAARLQATEHVLAGLKRGSHAGARSCSLKTPNCMRRRPAWWTPAVDPGRLVTAGARALVLTGSAETCVRAYVPEPMHGRAAPGDTRLVRPGGGRARPSPKGWFAVDNISYECGALASVDQRFEQRCCFGTLRGKIHWVK
jgi:hypothetical protein